MYFIWVNVTFYDAVSMIHDDITTANPFPYIACLSEINKTQQIRH